MDSSHCADPGVQQTHPSQGVEEEIAGVSTYKTGQGQAVIVVFTDIFGYAFPNTRNFADRVAEATGATVLIPDCFEGDPVDSSKPNYRDLLPEWRERHPTGQVSALADTFISTIKGHYQSIQVIGFCYGAKPVVYLITHAELSSTIKAAAVGHPSRLEREEAQQIKRPILFLCAETDTAFPPELKECFEAELTKTGLGTFITYPGTVHGFVVRPDATEQSKEQSEKAIQDAIEHFKKNI